MTGWDGRGIDVDSTDTPLRSDIVSERMTSISFGGESHNSSSQPGSAGRVNLTTAMIHAIEGGPASSSRWAATLTSSSHWETGGRSRSNRGWMGGRSPGRF